MNIKKNFLFVFCCLFVMISGCADYTTKVIAFRENSVVNTDEFQRFTELLEKRLLGLGFRKGRQNFPGELIEYIHDKKNKNDNGYIEGEDKEIEVDISLVYKEIYISSIDYNTDTVFFKLVIETITKTLDEVGLSEYKIRWRIKVIMN